jgi:hypothetical protein
MVKACPRAWNAQILQKLTTWYRAYRENLTVPQLVKEVPALYGPGDSLPLQHEPDICPFPKPDQSMPHNPFL